MGLSTDVPDVLPVEPGIWYRLHWTKAPWETGDKAVSVPGVAESHEARNAQHAGDTFHPGTASGYSCVSDPRALYAYLHSQRWTNLDGFPGDHRVVMFSGDHVGHGADGEPTVAPHDDTSGAVEMTWDQFEDRVLDGKVHMDPFFGIEMDPEGDGVSTYGMEGGNSPLQEEMVLMPHRLGISSPPWWEADEDDVG